MNKGNVLALLARPELDGVLVGGASLEPDGMGGAGRNGEPDRPLAALGLRT